MFQAHNPSQHGLRKHDSPSATYLPTLVPSESTQGQTYSVYFDLISAFNIAPP
jgi:hypothetical protein